MTDAYPLPWPQGWPRAAGRRRQYSRFRPSGLAAESLDIFHELQRLGATHIVISTNVEVRRDGLPYSGRRAPAAFKGDVVGAQQTLKTWFQPRPERLEFAASLIGATNTSE